MPLRYSTLLVILACAACRAPTETRLDQQITFEEIDAPTTIAAPGPLVVNVRLPHGACHDDIRVLTTAAPGLITLEARAVYSLPRWATACIGIGVLKDTTLSIPAVTSGALIVRGLQPDGLVPLDVAVTVTPN